MKYIQLLSKEHFKEVMKEYDSNHKPWMRNHFRENTCYVIEGDYFVSLDKITV